MTEDRAMQTAMYCRKCGYALVGLSENRCPECGRIFDPANGRTFLSRASSWRRRRLARRIGVTVLAPSLLATMALAGYGVWPKAVPHPMEPTYWTAHFRGLGLTEGDGILGRRWTYVTHVSPDDGGTWKFEFHGPGYNPFKGFYPTGRIREEGECFVEQMGFENGAYPDPHRLRSDKCYKPDGTLGSQVVDGTGTQTIWTPSGTKVWELELRDGQRVRLTQWHPNGQLRSMKAYVDNKEDGAFTKYDAAGNKTIEGANARGRRVGKWTYYNPDGSVAKAEQY